MKEKISAALSLLTANQGEGWFCVIEEPAGEKFVQFAYDQDDGLYVDLPKVALTEDELAKAVMLFSEYNISLENRTFDHSTEDECGCGCDHDHDDCGCGCEDDECGCDDDDECCGPIESFNSKLKDNAQAAEIALRVMKEVYGLKDDTLLNVTISQ